MDILNMMDNDSLGIDTDSIHFWESMIGSDMVKNNLNTIEIEPSISNQYKNNLYGLLHNIYNIPNEAFYINMRINNFKSSLEYNGELKLNIVNPDIVESIIEFKR